MGLDVNNKYSYIILVASQTSADYSKKKFALVIFAIKGNFSEQIITRIVRLYQ